jgi:phosphate transport system substrate-binding protein
MRTCSGSNITYKPNGSLVGVRELDNSPNDKASRIAMSDGFVPSNEHPSLVPHPVGVVVFAVVVNRTTRIHDVSLDQLRQIYQGRVTNWKEVGGQDLPISLVSRGSESGTRGVFETKILNASEKPVSSNDCMKKDRDPTALVVRCERPDTESLLQEVDKIEGAIGYAETAAAARFPDVDRVQLDGRNPDIEAVKLSPNPYMFYTVEYFYSYGQPERNTFVSAFLKYMDSDTAKNILRRGGYTPCVDGQQDLTNTLCH